MKPKLQKVEMYEFRGSAGWVVYGVLEGQVIRLDDEQRAILHSFDCFSQGGGFASPQQDQGNRKVGNTIARLRESRLLVEEPKFCTFVPPTRRHFNLMCLHVCHACNLACEYCYAGQGSYGAGVSFMEIPVAKAAVDIITSAEWEPSPVNITFFGGEPLLNMPLLEWIVSYATTEAARNGKSVAFGVVTNGTLLSDEVIRFLNRHRIGVEVSVDGDQKTHDRMRPMKDGSGSFASIMPGVRKLLLTRKGDVAARAVITRHNVDIAGIRRFLLEQVGFRRVIFRLAASNAESAAEDGYTLRVTDYEMMHAQDLESSLLEMGRTPATSQGHQLLRRHYRCGGCQNLVSVTPDGTFYYCHRLAEDPRYRVGHVFSGVDWHAQDAFLARHVDTWAECRGCWARYRCGGHCEYERVHLPADQLVLRCAHRKKVYRRELLAKAQGLRNTEMGLT